MVTKGLFHTTNRLAHSGRARSPSQEETLQPLLESAPEQHPPDQRAASGTSWAPPGPDPSTAAVFIIQGFSFLLFFLEP